MRDFPLSWKCIDVSPILLGKLRSRDGDIFVHGILIDSGSEKVYRVCRISLTAETFALSDAMDIALRSKVLIVEMFDGRFLKALMGGWMGNSTRYKPRLDCRPLRRKYFRKCLRMAVCAPRNLSM